MLGLDFRKMFGLKRTCKDCQGRGQGQEQVEVDGMIEVNTFYCETCKGKGYITNDDDTDDFDLAGVGVTEDDDNE